jgi:hypothetical protein
VTRQVHCEVPPQPLRAAHDFNSGLRRPAPDADSTAWRQFQHSARVYEHVANIDWGNHHEAMPWRCPGSATSHGGTHGQVNKADDSEEVVRRQAGRDGFRRVTLSGKRKSLILVTRPSRWVCLIELDQLHNPALSANTVAELSGLREQSGRPLIAARSRTWPSRRASGSNGNWTNG